MISYWILVLTIHSKWSEAASFSIPIERVNVDYVESNTTILNDFYAQQLTNRQNLQYHGNHKLLNEHNQLQAPSALENRYCSNKLTSNRFLFYPATFQVIFDTGSSILWIPKAKCKSSGILAVSCKSGLVYDPKNSETVEFTDRTFKKKYGTGSVKGELVYDYVAFGDPRGEQLKLKRKVLIGLGTEMEFLDSGILGLGPRHSSDGSSIMHETVKQGLLDKPIFTTYHKRCSATTRTCRDGGRILFGEEDKENCQDVEAWIDISRHARHWSFEIDSASLGSAHLHHSVDAMSDSGTSFLILPKKYAKRFARGIGARHVHDQYLVACDKEFSFDFEVNGKTYSIPAKHMLLNRGDGECELAILGDDGHEWILGAPFAQTYCQVHDVKKRRIGFAKAKETVEETEPELSSRIIG